jgi:DNA-binding NarL/FixJ family response regulator
MRDKVSHRAKLTPKQVRWARKQIAKGVSFKEIARHLPVSETTVQFLGHGKIYRGVK